MGSPLWLCDQVLLICGKEIYICKVIGIDKVPISCSMQCVGEYVDNDCVNLPSQKNPVSSPLVSDVVHQQWAEEGLALVQEFQGL